MPTKHAHWTAYTRTLLVLALRASSSQGLQPSVRPAITRSKTPAAFPARRFADIRAYAASGADGSSASSDRTRANEEASATAAASEPQNDRANTSGPLDEAAGASAAASVLLRNERRTRREDLATKRRAATKLEEGVRDNQDKIFLLLATVPPLLAFLTWGDVSQAVATFLGIYGAVGRAVDGNQFTTNLLRPTIVGVVVPVISIALATLVSTTVNVLRERQVELRALVNKEACELRLLRRAVFGMFGTRQHAGRRARALALLHGYAAQLTCESNVGAVEALEELQLNGGIAVNELDRLAAMLHGVDGAAASRQGTVEEAEGLIKSLNGHRSDRVALLLSVFPAIHWGILAALSVSVCVTFLLVSNQQVLQYLNSVQLRTLFAILVGVGSGTAALCLDLADPFRGSFSIAEASSQLGDLRICLEEDVAEASAEAGEVSSSIVQTLLDGLSDVSGDDDGGGRVGKYIPTMRRSERISNQRRYRWLPDEMLSESVGSSSSKGSGGASSSSSKESDFDEAGAGAATAFDSADNSRGGNGSGGSGQWGSSQPRYGLASTLYFHLLTGPLGSNVRVLGDVIAWAVTIVAGRARALSRRLVALSSALVRKGRLRWPWKWRRRRCKPE